MYLTKYIFKREFLGEISVLFIHFNLLNNTVIDFIVSFIASHCFVLLLCCYGYF